MCHVTGTIELDMKQNETDTKRTRYLSPRNPHIATQLFRPPNMVLPELSPVFQLFSKAEV